ncbi:hypothetical protein DSO57_1002271 [Entomophthora muscae]|uniref:Uncharacterized protein n=1 Tax=Entomophthora muscae TaxID=34485 RepID=A0ACC2TK27_9FUNG|nr:hypothetical protein DSO57_1002271 [Entomophthora muscae]
MLASVEGVKKIVPNFTPSKPKLNTEEMDKLSKLYRAESYPEFGDKSPRFGEVPTSRSPVFKLINAHDVDPKIISKAKDLVFGNLDSGVDFNHPVLKSTTRELQIKLAMLGLTLPEKPSQVKISL